MDPTVHWRQRDLLCPRNQRSRSSKENSRSQIRQSHLREPTTNKRDVQLHAIVLFTITNGIQIKFQDNGIYVPVETIKQDRRLVC